MSVEHLVTNNILNNVVKKTIDFCKEEANEILKNSITALSNTTDLDILSYNPNNTFSNGSLLKVKVGDLFLGGFIYAGGVFLPYAYKTTPTPTNKADYAQKKREFEIQNFSGIKISESGLLKIEKIISGYSDEIMSDIVSAIREHSNLVEYKNSYRITKDASNVLTKQLILDVFEESAKKPVGQLAGLSLLRLYGYAEIQPCKDKITQSQKDKLINILTDSSGLFKSNAQIEQIIKNLSFQEKADLLLPLSVILNNSDNYVKAHSELKADTALYSRSSEYSLNSSVLAKNFGIKDISYLAQDFSDLNIKTNIDFKYSGETANNTSYFVKNIAFEKLDVENQNFKDFMQSIKEQKEILNKMDLKITNVGPNVKNNQNFKIKLK